MNLQKLFSVLEISESDSLIMLSDPKWKEKVNFPSRVIRLLEDADKWSPTALFCFDNKPLILFFENPVNKEELHKSIWNFNESPIVIISEIDSVTIFNGFAFDENTKLLKILGGEDKLTDFKYFELVTGKTFEKYHEDFNYKERVDYSLLRNIEETQNELQKKYNCSRTISNALLGKIIFIRYLIDRKVKLNFDGVSRVWNNEEFCELLLDKNKIFQFFEYLQHKDNGFNGNLFPISKENFDHIPNGAFALLKRLLEGDEIKTGQQSLFEFYDFSVLPIEFISNVYERFIGKENQAKAGAYYTPTFLVDYIISQTVAKKLNENNNDTTCKVLDPACGSGIFLVETLRKIIEKHVKTYGIPEDKTVFKEIIKQLATDNIFGIDKDESAVQVAIFSVYLTLLDYQKPAEIENFKFPILLNTNFFVADFFDTEAEYNKIFRNKDFDFILGNPPWFRGKGEKEIPLYVKYINLRAKTEKTKKIPSCEIGGKEIAQAFVIRSSDFSKANTKNALILTSKVLYNLQSIGFRKYFLHNCLIERVFELAPVRREVFHDKAIAPACVLFFRDAKGKNTDSNIIEHIALKPSRFFSMFKIFSIYRNDIQIIQQKRLKDYDWLWKVLVYGSYLDFSFIRRLKDNYSTIHEKINKDKNIIIGQGITVEGGDSNDASDLLGKLYINTKSDIQKFWIKPDIKKWNKNVVHRVRNTELYNAPVLLIKKGFLNDFSLVSAISYKDAVYTDSLTGVKTINNNVDILRQFEGLLSSSLAAYYNLLTFSSSGIEREVVYGKEILSLPYSEISNISPKVKEIEFLQENYYNQTLINSEDILEKKIRDLNNQIYNVFSITIEEHALIDYAENVIIPLQMKHKGHEKLLLPFKKNDKILNDYANLFIKRFASNFEKIDKKFIVEIWHTSQIIGMFFKVIPVNEYTEDIKWDNKQNESTIIKFITKLGSEKIADQLFVQKDIRGFEKEFFYIFKPNEKRLWHKAIGYLDVNEFADAILKAGRDSL